MISLQQHEVIDNHSNNIFFSSNSPFKMQSDSTQTSANSYQNSPIDNNNYQGQQSLSDEKLQNNCQSESLEKLREYPMLQQQDSSTEESNNNQDDLSQTTQQVGEEANQKTFSHLRNLSYSEMKVQGNQLNENDIQIGGIEDDDDSSEEKPLQLPFAFEDEEEGESADQNTYSCDQEYQTDLFEQDSDLKESNSLYSCISIKGNRKEMQDKYSVYISYPNLQFYGVFDGHGNDTIANYLKNNLFQAILSHPSFFSNVQEAITSTFMSLDEYFQESQEFQGSGCVCVCALIVNGNLYVANLGDCRAVIFDKFGNSRDLSFDHTPSNRKDEVERIISKNGFCLRSGSQLRVSGELNVTRAFGDKRYKPFIIAEPEIIVYDIYSLLSEFEFREVFLVLASDGLWHDYNINTASELCSEGFIEFPQKAVESIFNEKQCHRDNTTILSVNLQNYYLCYLNSMQLIESSDNSSSI
ncbi:hypothetical protein ABPG72_009644 [Tetrahymena utriculariae]